MVSLIAANTSATHHVLERLVINALFKCPDLRRISFLRPQVSSMNTFAL